MGSKLKPLLILLSVALNGAFAVTWLCQIATGGAACPELPAEECPLARQLGASPSQWQQLEPHLTAFCRAAQGLCRQINRQQRELIDLLAADPPDRAAIRGKQEEILAGQRQMQELVVEHLLAQKALLTPQQQRTFFDLIRLRCGCTEDDAKSGGEEGPGCSRGESPRDGSDRTDS